MHGPMPYPPDLKADLTRRLARIEGQVRGLARAVEDDRYCVDLLTQVASVQEALRGVSRAVTRNHLDTCVTDALRSGDPDEARRTVDELMTLVDRQKR